MATALQRFERTLDEHGRPETITPDCPYCDQPVSGEIREYGGSHLHKWCYEQFGNEMAAAFPDELAPIDPEAFDFLDPDWCQPEDETIHLTIEEQECPF